MRTNPSGTGPLLSGLTTGRRVVGATILVAMTVAAVAAAQTRRGWFGVDPRSADPWKSANVAYDGRFTFARLRYPMGLGGFDVRREPPWSHDYPTADIHLARILADISEVDARVDGSNVFSLEDPALSRYPIAYMAEPGFWTLDEAQAVAFRHFLLKGGFAIFDDFRAFHLDNFAVQLRRVLPEARLIELDGAHPVFHAFFEIDSPLDFVPPYDQDLQPQFLGVFEDNDPDKRLMIVANYNNDLGEYWEFSDTGFAPVDLSNEAYKFGVNYVMYGLTH